jgi:hypothetical protein
MLSRIRPKVLKKHDKPRKKARHEKQYYDKFTMHDVKYEVGDDVLVNIGDGSAKCRITDILSVGPELFVKV